MARIVLPVAAKLRQAVVDKLEAEQEKLTTLSQEMFWKLVEEFVTLEQQLAYYQEKLEALATTHPECQRLMTIPGIGPITATALVAAVGDVGVFKNGRQFAAWLGLVPRQHSTGGQTRLLGISKRGDSYVRKLLIRRTGDPARVAENGRSQPMDERVACAAGVESDGGSGREQECPDRVGAAESGRGLW